MMLRQKQTLAPKIKLNQTLRSWLPILQSGLDELKETLEPFIKENPFATIEHKNLEKSEDEILFIGAEGGFSQHERAKIKRKFGLNSPNILRSNTAIISVCAKKLL